MGTNQKGDNDLGIVMDDAVISSPYVDKTQLAVTGINSDSAIIAPSSNATVEWAKYLAQCISGG